MIGSSPDRFFPFVRERGTDEDLPIGVGVPHHRHARAPPAQLREGTHATFTVSGTVPASTTGALINAATLNPPAGATDPVPADNIATSGLGTTVADVAIVKTGPASAGSNGTVSYAR